MHKEGHFQEEEVGAWPIRASYEVAGSMSNAPAVNTGNPQLPFTKGTIHERVTLKTRRSVPMAKPL